MYNELLKQIKKYDNITIFRHKRPDGDAVFSSFAFKEFIKTNFKDKKVKLAGFETFDLAPKLEKVSDKFIKSSLAIVLDVSGIDRIDDRRVLNADSIIVIDHHPVTPLITNTYFVEPSAAATCELLAKIFLSKTFKDYTLSPKTCEYLLCGILTDSKSFSTTNTTSDTLYYASKLVEISHVYLSDLNDYLFLDSLDDFKKSSIYRSYLKVKEGVGYLILNKNDLKKINMSFLKAKVSIDEFSNIKELKIWTVFVYNEDTGLYDGSLRSRRKYVINDLCAKYNGGGHKNACGVKNLSKKQVENLINNLVKIAHK